MLLEVKNIHTYYGTSHILFGINLDVETNEAVALLGRNGAGKTTTMRSIMGLTRPKSGRVVFHEEDITQWPVHKISHLGLGYVPEDRMVFPDLTVWENLSLGLDPRRQGKFSYDTAYDLFPVLGKMKNRPGGMISGGEQQMLAIARSLMTSPKLLLLDEPLEGLSPLVIHELSIRIRRFKEQQGLTILISEQNVRFAIDFCSRVYVIDKGIIRFQGSTEEFRQNEEVREKYLLLHVGRRRKS
jgi:branched-chain amino acid transport system ATP-binding protein